ncbi:endoribonuclease Dicer-like [Asterias rubens]|uniref:endoribonuclease Dicer-like n=1 Tax=Asterias rubens TaxID=7604 RepID=UPI0014550AD6|nr:endoribonuclease Dicer-like [Asterias rubens]
MVDAEIIPSGSSSRIITRPTNEGTATQIFTPRQYQVELLDAALDHNAIVCLQSNAGKTFIAVMLIKELSKSLRIPTQGVCKQTVFLVNDETLLSQQSRVVSEHTDLAVIELRDETDWDSKRKELARSQVLVMTAQIFLKMLQHDYLRPPRLNLLIFDECHHAVQAHPYCEIVQLLAGCHDASQLPRIMGSTASILHGKCEPQKLKKKLGDLERALTSVAETYSSGSLSRYCTKPKEAVVVCETKLGYDDLTEEVNTILNEALVFLLECNVQYDAIEDNKSYLPAIQAIKECLVIFKEIGFLGLRMGVPLLLKELQKLEKLESDQIRKLLFHYSCTQLRLARKSCENIIVESENPLDLKFTTSKVRRLIEVLKEFQPSEESKNADATSQTTFRKFPDRISNSQRIHNDRFTRNRQPHFYIPEEDEDESASEDDEEDEEETADTQSETTMYGIVFVNHRFIATVLDKLVRKLQKKDPELTFINNSCILGHGGGGLSTSGVSKDKYFKRQEEIMRKFRRHEINLLFATSAVEEGVDVPKCNLVVRFDAPDNYRSYVQSKGRARAPNSHYIMLVQDTQLNEFTKELSDFQEIDKILQRKCQQRDSHQSLDDLDLKEAESLCPPYKPSSDEEAHGVTMATAISLVNRYCSKLPSDTFTHLAPKCHTTVFQDVATGCSMYQSQIYLPINSPIRDPIQGPPMRKKKLAEMAVALKTCKTLHRAGELDDNLLPVGKDTTFLVEDCGYDQEVVGEGQGRPGTTKRRQYYNKEVARCLTGCHPTANQKCQLYEIHMVLASPLPDVLNVRDRQLYGPDETSQCFGLLTTKAIPKIPGFPVYTRAGELAVSIDLLTSDIVVTSEQLHQLQRFHSCIFAEVLRLEKPNLEYDSQKAEANYLIVPLNTCCNDDTKLSIDWDFLRVVSESSGMLDRPQVLPDYSKNRFVFSHHSFGDAVVTPIYRNIDQPQRYYIADILNDLPVTSPFPSDKYEKFIDYYFERYDIQVSNYQQPLLDVDCMSSRLNLLTPRYLNHKGKALPISNTQSKKNYLQKKQYLVPELCYVYPIPASLWRKAVCLPSLLYRLNSLLVAEEFRVVISLEAGIGMRELLQQEYPFPNMTFGWDGLDLQTLEYQNKEQQTDESLVQADKPVIADDGMESGHDTNSELEEAGGNDRIVHDDNSSIKENSMSNDDTGLNRSDNISLDQSKESKKETRKCAMALEKCNANISEHIKQTNDKPSNHEPNFAKLNGTGNIIDTCNKQKGSNSNTVKKDSSNSEENPEKLCMIKKEESVLRNESRDGGHSCEKKTPIFSILDDEGQDPATLSGPSPTLILQSLTMSNSSDGFNLERLEMLGDSFLKQAVTIYLYCTYPRLHEGKLSYMRSKQVSNFNLYRLGKRKAIAQKMQVALFDPAINWLAPGFCVKENVGPDECLSYRPVYQDEGSDICSDDGDFAIDTWDPTSVDMWDPTTVIEEEASPSDHDFPMMAQGDVDSDFSDDEPSTQYHANPHALESWSFSLENADNLPGLTYTGKKPDDMGDLPELPYEIHTQHSLSDKNLADSVEAIIGCYLVSCGFRSALIVMSWMGLRVLPQISCETTPDEAQAVEAVDPDQDSTPVGHQSNDSSPNKEARATYGYLKQPESPFFRSVANSQEKLAQLLVGMGGFETTINYSFRDKAYLVQAFTHASYHYNGVTDCYQRLEFLGDAILDYLITRHLFDHHQYLSPGALTDLRSALVNNTIFASLAVKFGYHKYFKALSPELFHVINNFVIFVKEKKEALGMGSQLKVLNLEGLTGSGNEDESEDIEVPKALGDIFESVAGAVYLDSGMSLDTVWRVYYPLMKPQIEQYAANLPISPVRELLEMEPETARFGPPERTMDGKTRVTVNVVGKGNFKGIGRNYRIAKATAARCALRHLKSHMKK